jgi:hypothetical protein
MIIQNLINRGAQANRKWCEVQPIRLSGKALCSGRSCGVNLSFPANFLCYFLLALKESKNNNKIKRSINAAKTIKD